MQALFYGLALLAGLSNPLQSASNAALNKGTGQPLVAGIVVYVVAVVGLLVCAAGAALFGVPLRDAAGKLGGLPWWAFAGGLCQLTFTLAAAVRTQKIGSAGFTVTVLVVAVVLSMVLDQYGLMGLPVCDATWPRMAGAGLAIAGVAVVSLY